MVNSNYVGQLIDLDSEGSSKLKCNLIPPSTNQTIYEFHCFNGEKHLVILALGGWYNKDREIKMLYGHEYWVGWPEPGDIYGGVPASYTNSKR